MALQAVGAAWMVEQPISSLAWYHPRLRSILRRFPKAQAQQTIIAYAWDLNKSGSPIWGPHQWRKSCGSFQVLTAI